MSECYAVVRAYSWDKDNYIMIYVNRVKAEQHRDLLNEEPYDPDDCQDHQVWTLPFTPEP